MIQWSRNLLFHVEAPMKVLREHADPTASPNSTGLVRKYNKIVRTLIGFEAQWHAAWCSSVGVVKYGFNATLLVEHMGILHVNWDPKIKELVREAEGVAALGLHVPNVMQEMVQQQEKHTHCHETMKHLVSDSCCICE